MQEPEQNMQELKYKLMTMGNETEPALASITWQFCKEVLAFSILSNSRWHQGRSSHPSRQRWHHRTKRGVKQQLIEKKNLNQYPSRNHIRHGPNKLELVKILLSKNLLSARKEEIRMENMLAGHTWIDLRTLGIQGEVDQGATCAGRVSGSAMPFSSSEGSVYTCKWKPALNLPLRRLTSYSRIVIQWFTATGDELQLLRRSLGSEWTVISRVNLCFTFTANVTSRQLLKGGGGVVELYRGRRTHS